MNPSDLVSIFDQQAAGYDRQWAKTAPIRDCLYLLLDPLFAGLPADARVLCVGVGTGMEMAHLARVFPRWTFTAVEPSGAMLEVCRAKAAKGGYASRCRFHEGYLDTLPAEDGFDAATCFLVSQFILDENRRSDFFRSIAARLRAGALLASSDLAADVTSPAYDALLELWLAMMRGAGIPSSGLEQMRAAYARDVAILPPARVAAIIRAGGFGEPVPFYQSGLIQAWFARRASG